MTQPAQNPIRILLVDDHQSLLWGLAKLIESERPRMEVVGTAADMAEALAVAQKEQPDVILLDIDLSGVSSLDSMPALLKAVKAHVLILTGVRDTKTHDRAMLSGARGIVHKEESAETILKAIMKVARGEIWLDRAATGRVFSKFLNPGNDEASPETAKIGTLTPREREIINTIINQGRSTNKQIADQLRMSEYTLRNHLTSIYSKLEVDNRLELVMYALEHGLNKPPA
jgi:two-component system, NarL family, nitrate/nitrite response regulator NarL